LRTITKEELIARLIELCSRGWIKNPRGENHGRLGNTLEDLLGIQENNLPIPNAAEWELKTQRTNTNAPFTLFHVEPSPRALRFVPQVLLPKYGWAHKEAGARHPADERSFRQTLNGKSPTDRGFMVKIHRGAKKVVISFDHSKVGSNHKKWLKEVSKAAGISELDPQPYWGFDDLSNKAGTKLLNCFFVEADVKRVDGKEQYNFVRVTMLKKFEFEKFLEQMEEGNVLVDFDARTGHNHGTKFRLRTNTLLPRLYQEAKRIV